MTIKVYMAVLVEGWPFDVQEQMLAPNMSDFNTFRDHVSARARRDRDATVLKERATALKFGRSGDRLIVASLACLAVSAPDLLDVLAQAERSELTIVEMHTGREFSPKLGAAEIAVAFDLLKNDRQGPGRLKGRDRAAESKVADTNRRLALAQPYWHLHTGPCLTCKGSGVTDPALSADNPANEMCPVCRGMGTVPATINYLRTLAADRKGRPMAHATLYQRLGTQDQRRTAQKAHEAAEAAREYRARKKQGASK